MVPQAVHYIPVITTVVALVFSGIVFQRYREKGRGPHLLWWASGLLVYAVGTFTEGFVTLFGWHEAIFRVWYIAGALLGGTPLAQGTVYLLLRRRTAHRLTMVVVPFFLIAAGFVLWTPLDYGQVELHRLSGTVIAWRWVRGFSPVINTYAASFLIGGAIVSAYRFKKNPKTFHRYIGNVLIASGALLPAIGGAFTRFGYTEVLYVMELLGLLLIYTGYRCNVRKVEPFEQALMSE